MNTLLSTMLATCGIPVKKKDEGTSLHHDADLNPNHKALVYPARVQCAPGTCIKK